MYYSCSVLPFRQFIMTTYIRSLYGVEIFYFGLCVSLPKSETSAP